MDTHTDQSAAPKSLDSQSTTPATFPNVTPEDIEATEKLIEDLLCRLRNGEEVEFTIPGAPTVRIAPREPKTWVNGREIAHLFQGPPDPDFARDIRMEAFDHSPRDPWERRDDRDS
jgi:antitoxin (DNA-binding transcriptional repressor) of toxin-antitoxin stability system